MVSLDVRVRSTLAACLLTLTLGCGTDPPVDSTGDGSGTSSGESSTSMASATSTTTLTTTAPPTPMTTAVDTTTFGPGCGPDPCPEQCGPDCESTATCLASVWMCECDCPMTGTGMPSCPPVGDAVDEWVEPSMTPAIDCGSVGPGDDAMAWQTVHDCVVLSAAGTAFRAQWLQPDGADPIEFGTGARVIPPYELGWFERSEPDSLVRYLCTTIEATPDCVVEPGQMCLTCVDQAEDEAICPLR